ncbi:STAS domain-containing protein [Streptomyces spororaveus]|uniref:Anti-sigma factor antagonist n=1 Tax=Streptomyces spororaveus TaxID=284039 RepID=A0ABQ3T551_9ACTN|nr:MULTISPECIES: STAS domain-containing protein [Streptomyces]MCX5308464.1 STAS domain-containing protein [Streptomyces sp. NBC_00160]GHI75302.1 anti-sigma factor antagonist [Streptomyces spororaveus]
MLPIRFQLGVSVQPDATVVTVAGELDMTTCPSITQATDTLALKGQTLALDLSAVTHMDSSGLNMLLTLRNRARAEHGELHLRGVPRQPLRVLDLTGTRSLFTLRPCLTP